MGLLYLRLCSDPKDLWEWFEPHLRDRAEIILSSNGSVRVCDASLLCCAQRRQTHSPLPCRSVGLFAKKLLTEPKHQGQMFPRIPVLKMKEFASKLERILPDARHRSRSPERRAPLAASIAAPVIDFAS